MVTITNLETQLVTKIAALDGSQTIKELMILKKSAENTSVDITALDARIDTYIATLSGASTDTDLLLSNKSAGLLGPTPTTSSPIASIQRGTSSGGGLVNVIISAVVMEKTMVNHCGYDETLTGNQTADSQTSLILTSTTNLQVNKSNRNSQSRVSWEVIEYV